MKKLLLLAMLVLSAVVYCFAGDVAEYKDLGFSSDGTKFVFAQYGVADKSFQAWAEIFTVDILTNTYVKSAVFSTNPSSATSGKSGTAVFEALYEKNKSVLSNYTANDVSIDKVMYIRGNESKKSDEIISFKDYEKVTSADDVSYSLQRIMFKEGSGMNTKSSFYIVLEKKDAQNKVLSRQVIGTPDYKRKGIIDYTIEKVWTDEKGKNIVILVEKKVADANGTSIRYMIEAAPLQ